MAVEASSSLRGRVLHWMTVFRDDIDALPHKTASEWGPLLYALFLVHALVGGDVPPNVGLLAQVRCRLKFGCNHRWTFASPRIKRLHSAEPSCALVYRALTALLIPMPITPLRDFFLKKLFCSCWRPDSAVPS